MMRRAATSLGRLTVLLCARLRQCRSAHEMSMAEMELRETAPGEFLWQWTAQRQPAAARRAHAVVAGRLRGGRERAALRRGRTARHARDRRRRRALSAAMVKVYWLDGQSRVYTLTAAQPDGATVRFRRRPARHGRDRARLHRARRRAHPRAASITCCSCSRCCFSSASTGGWSGPITAFTLAHSLTLALSALGWLTLRSPPVEATIALSIVLVAGEALDTAPTLARRWPALVAFLFGLVHGLGFAGALRKSACRRTTCPSALLTFNVGVELGQLLVVCSAYVVYRVLGRVAAVRRPRARRRCTPSAASRPTGRSAG